MKILRYHNSAFPTQMFSFFYIPFLLLTYLHVYYMLKIQSCNHDSEGMITKQTLMNQSSFRR